MYLTNHINIYPKSLCSKRFFSFIGKQPILLEPNVKINISPIVGDPSKTFKRTEYATLLKMEGPLGNVSFPIVRGLLLNPKYKKDLDTNPLEGSTSTPIMSCSQQELLVSLDPERDNYEYKLTKYQEKFIQAMWGTTQSLLSNFAVGITEVRYNKHFL